ncbi:MAG TPA: DMT family transporter, partial [Pseudonocardiaceae bacterium]|nr:DMT family transporter [Pseudonocardiaceae bacterium]
VAIRWQPQWRRGLPHRVCPIWGDVRVRGSVLTGRDLAPTVLSAGQLTAATVLSALALPVGWHGPDLRPDAVGSVAVLGLLGTGVAYVLNYRLITDDGATVASTVTYLIPMVAVLFGVAVLGESLSLRVLVGMAVVLAGVGLVRCSTGRPPDSTPAPPKVRAAARGDGPGPESRSDQ